MWAGVADMRDTSVAQSMRPVLTMRSTTIERACSRPSMPGDATSNGWSLSSLVWGAWSVPTMSMVPSARASRSASMCSLVRSGGFTLYTVSKPSMWGVSSSRWCGVTSAVTRMPRFFAHRMTSTDSAVEMWQAW